MNYRTDLAIEKFNLSYEKEIKGIDKEIDNYENMTITSINIKTENAQKVLGKEKGTYITIEVPSFGEWVLTDDNYIDIISKNIKNLIKDETGTVLVVGLGNLDITPDALGIKTIDKIIVTRHISQEIIKSSGLDSLRSVAAFCPSVLGKTGIETADTVKAVVDYLRPSAVIIVDAFACKDLQRLGSTIQIADTGISPGSGVNNKRKSLNKSFLGCEVISLGIPTVVDALTIALDVLKKENFDNIPKDSLESMDYMMVTPKEIDLVVDRAASILSLSINKALQPHLSVEDISYLTA
ncbi:MAG: GPR endopeptidase [Oscillospiraceae bacterium]